MPAKTIRVFIDTNVWFSALYGSKNCQTIIEAHQQRILVAVISARVLDELIKNVEKKLPDQLLKLQTVLVSTPPEIVSNPTDIPEHLLSFVSLKDLPIFASAVQADVSFFITGNIKDFKRNNKNRIGKVTILTPREAVKTLELTSY